MTKKILALLLAAMMMLSVSAMAEEVPQIVFDETAAPYEGAWLDMGIGVAMYVPTDWLIMEVTEEQAALGVLAILTSADSSMALSLVAAPATDSQGNVVADAAAMAAELAASGAENVAEMVINGISAVTYEISAMDVAGLAVLDGEGYVYTFTFSPAADEAAAAIGGTILLSMSLMAAE